MLVLLAVAILAFADPPMSDRAAWREACSTAGYSCSAIPRPLVAESPLGGLLGRYRMGDSYILVNERAEGALAYAVRVHEMTHYLQWKHGRWKFTQESRCRNEREAFVVSNKVLKRLGADHFLVDWDKKKGWYGCSF